MKNLIQLMKIANSETTLLAMVSGLKDVRYHGHTISIHESQDYSSSWDEEISTYRVYVDGTFVGWWEMFIDIPRLAKAIDSFDSDPQVLMKNLGINSKERRGNAALYRTVAKVSSGSIADLYEALRKSVFRSEIDQSILWADRFHSCALPQEWKPENSYWSNDKVVPVHVLGEGYINY